MRISRPSPALLISLLALVVAMSGTAYAALAKNSVGSAQVKNNSLRGKDIRDNQLTGADVNESSLVGLARSAHPDYTEVAVLGGGYTHIGGEYNTAGYMKDSLGYVHLKGVFNCPGGGTVFVLPVGFRPAHQHLEPLPVGGAQGGNLTVNTSGAVVTYQPSGAAPCGIDHVVFEAAAAGSSKPAASSSRSINE